jgi:regulator of protease activity HflC (stomatin/prohibitin superfamily)
VRQTLPLVLFAMLLTFWLMSCLVVVKSDEIGVRTTFGSKPERCWMDPGLRVKWPWPVDRAQRVPARRIQSITIGHEDEARVPYLLWSKAHAKGEYKLVLGEGRELVSLEAEIYYYIKDPVQYVFNVQNPVEALKALSYRVLLRETAGVNLDHVLSRARASFSDRFCQALQKELDGQQMGICVIQVPLRGIHPPVDIAQSYQAVVSAQVEKVTLATKAMATRAEAIPMAEADKDTAVKAAGASAATRLGKAKGEAVQFGSVARARALAPDLYEERLWLERLEKAVEGKQVYLVEGKTAGSRDYWIDLRDRLNPEFP